MKQLPSQRINEISNSIMSSGNYVGISLWEFYIRAIKDFLDEIQEQKASYCIENCGHRGCLPSAPTLKHVECAGVGDNNGFYEFEVKIKPSENTMEERFRQLAVDSDDTVPEYVVPYPEALNFIRTEISTAEKETRRKIRDAIRRTEARDGMDEQWRLARNYLRSDINALPELQD